MKKREKEKLFKKVFFPSCFGLDGHHSKCRKCNLVLLCLDEWAYLWWRRFLWIKRVAKVGKKRS